MVPSAWRSGVMLVVMMAGLGACQPRPVPTAADRPAGATLLRTGVSPAHLTPDEVRQRQDKGESILIADVRSPAAYAESHIAGAVNTPVNLLAQFDGLLPKDQLIVVYCACPADEASIGAAQILTAELGYPNVAVLAGGTKAWQARGYAMAGPGPT